VDLIKDIKQKIRHGDALTRLIIINVAVFILINLYLLVLYFMNRNAVDFLGEDMALSASSSLDKMLHRPWSLITHMFAHIEFGHFFFNLITLYFMGQLFTQIAGSKKLWQIYFLGGISGYLNKVIIFNLLPRFEGVHMVLGASAAVMAVSVAAAVLRPKQMIFIYGVFKVELRWLVLVLVLLDLASIRTGSNSGGHIGHLGGAFFGFLYGYQILNGKDITTWLDKLSAYITSLTGRRKMKVASRNARARSDEEFNLEKRKRQKRVDGILDKIGRSGYDALTREEKDFLFKSSQK